MRIIAGKYRRRNIATPPGTKVTRPTSDRVRESVFNIIASEIPGSIMLDIFAGSGALGIEALSRGAEHVAFVERDPNALACIRANLRDLGVPASQAIVVQADATEFLRSPMAFLGDGAFAANFAASTTLIFADPPYDSAWYDVAVELVERSGLCAAETLAVVEMAQGREMPDAAAPWDREDERKYGKTRVEFWRRQGTRDTQAQEDSE